MSSSNGYNWIKIGDVQQNEKFIYRTEEKIIKEGVTRSRFVHKGDFLLSNSMSFGRPYILKIDGCIHDGWLVIQNYQPFFDSNFLYYLLCSEYILKQYKTKAAGSGVLNLNKELVSSIKTICPTIKEQQAIAAALSDVDELLNSLDQLIAKKQDIRLATMQELLTGKKRLPGFQDNWGTFELGQCGNLQKQVITPSSYPRHIFYEYSMPAFDKDKKPTKIHGENIHSSRLKINGPIILFNKLNVRQKRVWLVNTTKNNSLCSTEFLPYQTKKIIPDLLKQILLTDKTTFYFESHSAGTSNSQKRITPSIFLEYKCYLPPSLAEQQAIASVLSDMDAEIEALEARRDKVRHIKAGMMQELLTGKTRLISSGEEA